MFGFDINFGRKSNKFEKLKLDQFIQLVCSLPQSTQAMIEIITKKTSIMDVRAEPMSVENGTLHVFSVTNGLMPSGAMTSRPSDDMWQVRAATFSFMIAFKFAASSAAVLTGVHDGKKPAKFVISGLGNPINAKPMEINSVTSIHDYNHDRPAFITPPPQVAHFG